MLIVKNTICKFRVSKEKQYNTKNYTPSIRLIEYYNNSGKIKIN